jgi:hypothetical protein
MGRHKFLNAVDTSGISGEWRKLIIDNEDIVEAHKSPAREVPKYYSASNPRSTRMHGRTPDQDVAIESFDWVRWEAAHTPPNFLFELGTSYAFHEAWSTAVTRSDPTLAPHVQFRMLKHRDDAEALLFLKNWGPLFGPSLDRQHSVAVDLRDFWNRHLWFVSIAQLYEALEEPLALQRATGWMQERSDAIRLAVEACSASTSAKRFAVYLDASRPVGPILTTNFDLLLSHAVDLIASQFSHPDAGPTASWEIASQTPQLSFRPIRLCSSLWTAMWEMFGLDTERGFAWRSCRICTKYFYPSQANSVCCSSEHQSLWSKRQWARRSRSPGSIESKSGKRTRGQEAVPPSSEKSVVTEVKMTSEE